LGDGRTPEGTDVSLVSDAANGAAQRDRLLALLQLQRELLGKAASGAGTRVVLELLVELIEDYAHDAIGSVLLLDRESQTLHTLVAPRLPADYCAAIDGLAIGESAGSCGTAAALNRTVVVEDIATDPLWEPYREIALGHGLRACWSTPIDDGAGQVVGTFALYYDSVRRPTDRDLELVDVAAGIASIVLERERALASAAEEATERSEIDRRYRALVEQLPLVIYADSLDVVSSNIFTSRQIEAMLGYSVEEWQRDEMLFVKLLHPEDRDRVLDAHARTHKTHEPLSVEYRLQARDGHWVWIRDEGVVVTDDLGEPLHLQGYLLDISAEREAEEQLRRQALYDPLTGLSNRAHFSERLEHAVATRKRSGRQTALLFVDLNNFKSINDRFGHDTGDAALRALAEHLELVIRTGDTAARLGGDEFGVILQSVDNPAEASSVAQRLHKALAEPLEVQGRQLKVDASIGIALGDEPHTLLKEADAAMYRAKSHPTLGIAFFDPALDEAALVRFRRIGELGEAVEHGELRLHYQPIVTVVSSAVDGYEALLRWQHPQLGELQPLEFIPLAEESGLIVSIGQWVLEQACAHIAALSEREGHPLEIAVNISARQLQHPDFVSHVEAALEVSGLPPGQLILEITESVLIDTGDVEERLRVLKNQGIQIALDDFGTGYGSLAYLQRLPVDIVKIDRSFTASADTDEDGRALLRAIIGLGDALGTRLVAEGIERASQAELIGVLGCSSGQGFHYGRPAPLPADAVALESFEL
jgi:diguanylate cyclase (GGDEF)-like protein/PAS domain S-box-containing protein